MITVNNTGKVVKVIEDGSNSFAVNGKKVIVLDEDLTFKPYESIDFDTKLNISMDVAEDTCIIEEYMESEDVPLSIVGETYNFGNNKGDNVVITIHNMSNEEYTLKKGETIATLGYYHICTCQVDGNEEYWLGLLGKNMVFANDNILVYSKNNDVEYQIETIIESDGSSYIKLVEKNQSDKE